MNCTWAVRVLDGNLGMWNKLEERIIKPGDWDPMV